MHYTLSMKSLTEEEFNVLSDQLDTFDPATAPLVTEERLVVLNRLTARGLCYESATDWLPDPEHDGYECRFAYWNVTSIGRIALICYIASKTFTVNDQGAQWL